MDTSFSSVDSTLNLNTSYITMTTESFMNYTTPSPESSKVDSYVVPVIWAFLVLIGTVGNGLVIYVLSRYGERTVTNIYVVNLAVSDLTFIVIVLPITAIHFVLPSWMFGLAICKICIYLIYVTLHATCLTLMAMTIDRYLAVVHSIRSMSWRNAHISTIASIAVWVVSFAISSPFVIYTGLITYPPNVDLHCEPIWPSTDVKKVLTLWAVVTSYILPLTVIIGCYAGILQFLSSGNKLKEKNEESNGVKKPLNSHSQMRRKRRVTRMVAIVVLLFAVCWLPIHVITIWITFDPYFPKTNALLVFKIFAHTLSYANSCVNPFVYAFLNDGFRKAFVKKFPRLSLWLGCRKRDVPETSLIDKAVEARPGMEVTEVTTNAI